MLVLSCLAMGMAYGQRKQRTEDWNKETSVGNEIPGKKTFGYIVGENGDLIYDGPCTITCTLPYTRVYESTCWSRNGITLYNDYEHKGKYKWQGSYKKGLLDGAVSVEDEYYRAGEWLTTNLYLTDYTTISYSFALSGKFTGGVPNGSFSVVQDGEEVLDATYKDGALVGYFYCHEYHGNISDGGKLTGEWVVDRYVEMEFIEGVLLSKTTSDRSTRPADVELARKYAKGEITKQELWDKHFIVVRTASIDLGSCARAIIMSETYDLPHFNDKENIFYYEYLDYIVEDSVIRAEVFKDDKELTSIVVPDGVTEIGERAFSGCSNLTSITIPESVTQIGERAFEGCSSLTSITIPNSVTEIGSGAFTGCSSLTSITIPNSVEWIGDSTFSGCRSLTNITIPSSIAEIGRRTFSGCSNLTSITIPESVTSIGGYAFYDCSSLTSITIPNSVTSIGDEAFKGCSSLTSITIPESVTEIGWRAFSGCSSLKCVRVGNPDCYEYFKSEGVPDITFGGKNASENGRCLIVDGKLVKFIANGLTECYIPEGVTTIGYYAFRDCSSLTRITIPNSVTSIESGTFSGCTGELIINCDIPDGERTPRGGFGYHYYYPLMGSKFTKVTIGDDVTRIGDYAFYDCDTIEQLTIGNSVLEIGTSAFKGCTGTLFINCNIPDEKDNRYPFKASKFKVITIGEGVTKIGDKAFAGCESLERIRIPMSITEVGDDIFSECKRLLRIYIPKEAFKVLRQDYYLYTYRSNVVKIK